MILSQKQRMKITWIFSETSLGSWSIKAKLHEGGYCGEENRLNLILVLYDNVSRKSPLAPSERFNCIEPSLRIKHITMNFGKLDHRQWRTNRLVGAEILENVTIYSY